MSIDERLEALTHSVELLAGMHRDTESEIRRTQKEIRRLGRYVRMIAIDHEGRLLRLEGEEEDDDPAEASGNGH